MTSILFLVWLLTTLWMAIDAKTHRIPVDKKPYNINNGALAWFGSGILLWIITFPYYLWKRAAVMNARRPPTAAPPNGLAARRWAREIVVTSVNQP